MATRNLPILAARILLRNAPPQTKTPTSLFIRPFTTNESGALLAKPAQVKLGLAKVSVVVTPFIYVGAIISREFAAWLEEHELFVPDDDDDDD